MRNAIKEQLIARELLVQEAKKAKIDKKGDIQLQIEAAKQAILGNAFLSDYLRTHPITSERIADIQGRVGETRYRQRAERYGVSVDSIPATNHTSPISQ